MMNEMGLRRVLPDQSSGSGHTVDTPRHPSIIDPILSKRVCFYKSGDPQFNGLRMVINNRTFKTFDALLDSLSKKVPLPFGVRNITTPRGVHAIHHLDELEDGKSYICSDSRKVKPINLALARKKLPPWYNASPVGSRRRIVQQARFFPGRNIHKEPVVVGTPKRLLVFRNGIPTARHTVVLHKRTTPTFESILGYISEMIHFHVVKLYTSDGRRVDGLPALIMCSGTVVAAGREPFRPANYEIQKLPAPTKPPTNRMGHRRRKTLHRKKKLLSYTSKSRKFSTSSERYIVNQIHNSIAESSCDLPSNHTNSVEFESGRILQSVAETDRDTCLDDGGQDCLLPSEDDIEKSFRVNQDGSMTVEMRVRLTIKEEETIHWTTTLTRSSVANQLNPASLTESEAEQEIGSLKSNSLDLQSPVASIDTINEDKAKDNNGEDPPSLGNRAFSENSNEEDDINVQTDMCLPRRVPTPGHKNIRTKQASVESINSVTAEGIQEDMVGSYSYIEQTEHGAMTEQYCVVKQSSTRPVPKPRRLGSVDASNRNTRNVSTFKSAEIVQIESSREEVTETVLHMYEQQTCHDHFFANLCAQSASGIPFCRPATSGTGQLYSNNEFEPELWRPSTASESISIWRAESTSSDVTLPSLVQAKNPQQRFPKPTKGKDKPQQREVNKDKRVSPKPKVINKRVHRLMSPGKRRKENSAEAEKRKKVKTFSSAGFIKKIYGNKLISAKSPTRPKKGQAQNGDRGVTTKSSQQLDQPNIPSALKENTSEKSRLNIAANEVSQSRGTLTRQTSMHQEKKNENESYDISESISLPAFTSSSSDNNEYVENWLEKARLNPPANPDEESKTLEAVSPVQTENGRCEESESKMILAEEAKCLEDTSELQTSLKNDLLPENVLEASVKQRIQSFENKSSPSVEKTANQQITHSHTTTTTTENYNSLAQSNIEEIKPLSNPICSEVILPTKTSTEMPSGSELDNESSPIKISFQKATPSNTLSMELLLPPPPPAENTEPSNTEYCVMDVSSVASSPLYRLSSESSKMSDNHPLSISPTSDKAISPTDHAMEMETSIQTDIPSTLEEAPLPRTPSIKRAPLVSNMSLDRKMSLRKACLDKYTLCGDATSETTTSSTPINIVSDNVLPNGVCSTETQQPSETPREETQQSNSILDLKDLSCYTSASPTSLTSEERMASASISSSGAPTPSDLLLKETETPLATQKEASSPKPLVKKAKLMSSPSPERKSQTKKSTALQNSPKLPHLTPLHNQLYKPKLQKKPSPYSQSVEMASPPVRHKASRKLLSRNLSSDAASEPTSKTQRKTSERKRHQIPQSIKSSALLPSEADQSHDNEVNKTGELITADQEKSKTETQIMPQPLSIADQPNMKPVLEKICYSIKSIRQITQNKRRSCLEKSNSLPDFSSHVASTFGSSSKALLAFLSVMTLKEGITNLNMDELNANNVSCAEALKMIDSLKEIASIEDSHKLKVSLSNLQQSASKQLLQSWKGFQELGDKCKSRGSTPNDSEHELITEDSSEKDCGIDENVIDELMDNLDIPEKLKEELASLSAGVKSDSDEELSLKDNSEEDEKANVDVSSIIKKITDINQLKQSSTDSTETAKHKPTDQATKDKDSKYGQNAVAKYPPAEPNDKQTPEERQLYSTVLFVKQNGEGLQSCIEAVNQEIQGEKKQQQGHSEDKSNQEKANMNEVISSKKSLEQDSCTSEVEEQDMEDNQLQVHSEDSTSVPENELTHDHESGSEQEGQSMSSANEDLEQKVSCEQSSSEAGEQHSSEEEPEVEREARQQESRESDDLSNPESHSEEEEDQQPSSGYYVCNARGKERISSPDSPNKSSSEEEQPEAECEELSNKDALSKPASPSNSEEEQQSQADCIGLNVSVDESTCNSGVDKPSSAEKQPVVKYKELKVIIEESLSCNEEEQESMDEEEHLDRLPDHREQTNICKELKTVIEETDEDKVSSEDAEEDLSNLMENQDSYTKKDNSSLKSDNLAKRYRFNADEDSGNDHSSCEEHVEVEQPKVEEEHINSSAEEELSYYEKESSSDEEPANMDRYIEESCTEYQEAPASATQPEVTNREKAVENLKHQSEEIISQSFVAGRVILLEKQVADAQKKNNTTESPPVRRFSQRNAPPESDAEDSHPGLPTSGSSLGTQSGPQSSLSFSYDCSGVITTEPEGNRVRSIREMFLAKSATDMQHGHRRFPSPNTSELSELRTQTSTSAGYQSQTSSERSSSEDDSPRKTITKGFVRRTIERLYGKKNVHHDDEEPSERPPSAQKQKEHSSIFSPFHTARSKAVSELSYFNSAGALDTLSEATRCIAFNAQVGPGDNVPIDNQQWLLKENTLIRKSVSDPVGISKTFTNSPQGEEMCEDTDENSPHSLFSTKSEEEDKKSSFSRKCTYFSLPHASDSEVCQDDLSIVSKNSVNGDSITDTKANSEDTKTWTERNGMLPAVADFKMKDNKVHPLPPDGEVVVVQPGKGQGAINRRLQEPDMLDFLYNFCGQNCPIL